MLQDDFIIDEENKSDAYSLSINSIILMYKPSSVQALRRLLDDNGYYGRYTIINKVTRRMGENVISIEVYLPNSSCSYMWPFRTLYNMTLGRLLKKIRIRKTPAMPYVMRYLSKGSLTSPKPVIESIDHLPQMLMHVNNSHDRSYYQYIVTTLVHAGLFKMTPKKKVVFLLKCAEDIKEVNENLFNSDNYLD